MTIRMTTGISLLVLSGLQPLALAKADTSAMGLNAELAARAQIEDTLNRYTYGLDNHDAKLYASAFTTDGVLWFKEKAMKGPTEIMGFILNASPTQPQHHLRLNSMVKFLSSNDAQVTSYFVTIYGDTTTGFKVGLVGTYNDVFVREHGKWLIKERKPGIFGPDPDTLKKDAASDKQ